MQAVILVAGRGTRMKELTEGVPKGLLQVAGRSLLEYALDVLPENVDEVIFIVGYLGSMIHDKFGAEYFGKRILYIEQEELNGTAGALWLAQDVLKDRFIVMNGDDIYDRADVVRITRAKDWALLVTRVPHMNEGGKVIMNKKGLITNIVEGEHDGKPSLMSANVFLLDTRIFSSKLIPKAPDSSEYGLPQTMLVASKQLGIVIEPIAATNWIQISRPEDLRKAEEILASHF